MSDLSLHSSIIKHFCEKYNISIEEKCIDDLAILTDELMEYNSHTNLTAVRDERDVIIKHHADSLAFLSSSLFKDDMKVIDVGCGAGFPGLPLKIARRGIDISFLDSTEKKLKFTKLACEKLSAPSTVLPMRAEEAANDVKMRESFDLAVSRAMANLPVLCELCLPFVKKGGLFVAYKGAKAADEKNPESEISLAKRGIERLGGKVENVIYYDLCDFYDGEDEDKKHCLIVIRKERNTPKEFPRRYAQILKKPL